MSVVFGAYAALAMLIGLIRPGHVLALSLFGYIYESYFGGNQIIGLVFANLTIPYAIAWGLTKRTFRLHIFDLIMLIFMFVYTVSALRSPFLEEAFLQIVKFISFGLGPWFLIRCFVRNTDDFNRLAKDFSISVVVLSILFGFVSEPNDWGIFYTVGNAHSVGWSLYLNAAICILLAYIFLPNDSSLFGKPVLEKIVAIAAFALVAYFAYLNGKRGSTMSPVIAFLMVAGFLMLRNAPPRMRAIVLVLVPLVLVGLPVIMQAVVDLVVSIPESSVRGDFKVPLYVVARFLGASDVPIGLDQSSAGRAWVYHSAWKMIEANPLFGNGVAFFRALFATSAHSPLLETWLEGGIFFLLACIALMVTVIWCGFACLGLAGARLSVALFLTATLGALVQMITALSLFEAKVFWLGAGTLVSAFILRAESRSAPPLAAPPPRAAISGT